MDWIGFSAVHRTRICTEAFQTLKDLETITEKDITSLSDSFSKRTPAAQRIIFGQRKTKSLQALLHWVKDFRRTDETPTIAGLNEITFKALISVAARREEVRKEEIENSEAVLKEASPGALESEATWHEWEPAFENYLSSTYGVDGVPLVYVIRPNDAPDRTTTFADFNERAIACAPLRGAAFDADKRRVHQLMVSFTQGQMSEDWIKPVKRLKNGREDMIRLRAHFAGEGNATRRIAVAERLRDTLYYKNERSMTFEVYCNKAQKMFNIFEQQGEPMTDEAKIRFFLKKIQHPSLQATVESLKTRMTTDPPGTITIPLCANHIASAVSELPEYIAINRNISAVQQEGGRQGAPESGIHLEDGSIWTGFYPNWDNLSRDEVDKVMDERARKRKERKKSGGGGSRRRRNDGDGDDKQKVYKTELTQLKKTLKKRNRKIAALKKSNSDGSDGGSNSGDGGSSGDDAGNQFGGKRQRKNNKGGK